MRFDNDAGFGQGEPLHEVKRQQVISVSDLELDWIAFTKYGHQKCLRRIRLVTRPMDKKTNMQLRVMSLETINNPYT